MTASGTPSASCTTARPLPVMGVAVKTSSQVKRWAASRLTVPVEVARRLLLEPEPVVLRRLLQELGSLLEDVLRAGVLGRLRRRRLRGRRLLLEPRVLVVAGRGGLLTGGGGL